MRPDEMRTFLRRPLVGVVGTMSAKGTPHAVPVWFRFDDERILIWTSEERRWVKNLTRDPRCSFTVQEHTAPFAAVVLRGRAHIFANAESASAEMRAITERYIPRNQVEAYVSQWPSLRTIVVIQPEKLLGWARGY